MIFLLSLDLRFGLALQTSHGQRSKSFEHDSAQRMGNARARRSSGCRCKCTLVRWSPGVAPANLHHTLIVWPAAPTLDDVLLLPRGESGRVDEHVDAAMVLQDCVAAQQRVQRIGPMQGAQMSAAVKPRAESNAGHMLLLGQGTRKGLPRSTWSCSRRLPPGAVRAVLIKLTVT